MGRDTAQKPLMEALIWYFLMVRSSSFSGWLKCSPRRSSCTKFATCSTWNLPGPSHGSYHAPACDVKMFDTVPAPVSSGETGVFGVGFFRAAFAVTDTAISFLVDLAGAAHGGKRRMVPSAVPSFSALSPASYFRISANVFPPESTDNFFPSSVTSKISIFNSGRLFLESLPSSIVATASSSELIPPIGTVTSNFWSLGISALVALSARVKGYLRLQPRACTAISIFLSPSGRTRSVLCGTTVGPSLWVTWQLKLLTLTDRLK
mmetsp:Transcript_12503/g.34521  ORF Transcript_12503/g.34521 Transcript_12503/m.34521 type:complete len:263 (+) Transcript_12503:418-1206(+)